MFYILRFGILHEYEILNQNTNEKVRISEKKEEHTKQGIQIIHGKIKWILMKTYIDKNNTTKLYWSLSKYSEWHICLQTFIIKDTYNMFKNPFICS